MRICCYTCTMLPKIGGQEMVIDALARRYVRLGHEVVVLSPRLRDAKRLTPARLPYPVVWHPRFRSTRWFVAWYGRWLARLYRERPFDLLHCHDVYPSAYVAASCAALAAVPMVITSHGVDIDANSLLARKPFLRPRYELALRRAAAAIAISDDTANRFRAIAADCRIERIANGVDLAQYAADVPRPEGLIASIRPSGYLLFLGRLVWRKGVDLLVDAFAAAARETDMGLVIAGEGPDQAAFEARAAACGLGPRIAFVGRVEGAVKTWLVRNARCLVIPSRISEAFPLTMLESFAAGRPVIGADFPGVAELVSPGKTGLLVPPDSVAALTAALQVAITERALVEQMGRAARQVVESYDWDRVAQRHLAIYAELIAAAACRKAA